MGKVVAALVYVDPSGEVGAYNDTQGPTPERLVFLGKM